MAAELFELELFGEGIERRYRKMRPEVEAMPWGTLDLRGVSEEAIVASRKAWTSAAFQEHRTGVACCMTLQALLEARAPLDLVAMASRFPLDEVVHVELCARLAMELGGGTELLFDPKDMVVDADRALPPLLRAADDVVRFFCVGEALSIPLLRATWHAARSDLVRSVLSRIVRDEAAHGAFGFSFLDWALPRLDDDQVAHVGRAADLAIAEVHRLWDGLRRSPEGPPDEHGLGFMRSDAYLVLAERSLRDKVLRPLQERGVPLAESSIAKAPSEA
jgi:hypothetical protein